MTIDEIIADFELLDDWEDRYRYIIELGRKLPPMPDADHNETNKVRGCASQVWLTTDVEAQGGEKILHFVGDSDALIVRGLVAIALTLFDGKSAEEIRALDGLFPKATGPINRFHFLCPASIPDHQTEAHSLFPNSIGLVWIG